MLVNELHQGGIRALIAYEPTIFDLMQLPAGIAIDDVADHILYKYGDAPVFSPDPEVIKFYIGRWSKRHLPLWERYKAAIEAEYNPIENYDRIEESATNYGKTIDYTGTITDVTSGDHTKDITGSIIKGTDGTITDTPSGTIKVERDDVTTNDLSADNSSTYQPNDKSTLDGETKTSYDQYKEERSFSGYQEEESYDGYSELYSYNNLTQEKSLDHSDIARGTDTYESRIHGNIGVTTSQQMLTSELDLIPRLDLIDYIADDWHSEFNLMIYV